MDQLVKYIPIDDLRFDPANPRLPRRVDVKSGQAILSWMLDDATILELMGSIGAQGYFPGEPVLVVPRNQSGAPEPSYLVVEGNRRLAATILLRDPSKAPTRKAGVAQMAREARYRPDSLPALVFQRRDEILEYLGFRHVTGIKQWDPLAKARHVRQLVERAKEANAADPYREVAKIIGSRADYVARLLTGLDVYDHTVDHGFFNLRGVDEDSIEFSVLTTALSYASIAEFIGLRDEARGGRPQLRERNLRDLIGWMYRELPSGRTVLGESRNLKSMAAVVSRPEAVEALRAGESLADAAELTEEPLRLFQQSLRQARDRLQRARATRCIALSSP